MIRGNFLSADERQTLLAIVRRPSERLWGVMHRAVTHNKCYATFNEFAAAIREFFAETIPKRWKEFRDTVTDNFRVISHQDFRVLEVAGYITTPALICAFVF